MKKFKKLAKWIDGNVGISSEAIFMYMTQGSKPRTFDAPSDASDRNRCIILLNAIPEWWDRLKEIEDLNLKGTCNNKIVFPWNEQIPLIRKQANK